MKAFVEAYLFNNLGDDLFLDILTKRYPKTQFVTMSNYFESYQSNIKIYKSYFFKSDFISNVIKSYLTKKSDITISIGGSMYMEEGNRIKQIPKIYNDYYILGSNFGPYHTQEFLQVHKAFFSKVKDACFRENYSYDLFKDLKNIRKGADIVFNLDLSGIPVTQSKNVIISVINCKNRFPEKLNDYEKLILNFIHYYKRNGYKVTLMSFCKIQGDEEAIKRILNKTEIKCNVYFYNGNRNEALKILADSSIVIGTRFHANILGILMNKHIIPISYSLKTDHVLKDLGYQGQIIDIKNINKFNFNHFNIKDFEYQIDLEEIKKEAVLQFKALDEVLI